MNVDSLAASGVLVTLGTLLLAAPASGGDQVDDALAFIAAQQDLFHERFYLYDDKDSGGTHFIPSGFMGAFEGIPAQQAAQIVTHVTDDPFRGRTCLRLNYPVELARRGRERWAGIYWQAVDGDWSKQGYDLSRYVRPGEEVVLRLQVRAVGAGCTTTIFKVGGTDADTVSTEETRVELTRRWAPFAISLGVAPDLRSLGGGLAWVANSYLNPSGCELLLDDVRLEFGLLGTQARLNEPRFVRSYVPAMNSGPDSRFTNAAYLYDNALMVLAWCARGRVDDLRRARLICDAMVYAQRHDPAGDGRLRNAYSCGDLADPFREGAPRAPGWWDDAAKQWQQDAYCLSVDCGNMAWAGLALLTFWETNNGDQDSPYLRAAERLGAWIHRNAHSKTGPGGYTGDLDATFKSTEHNIDIDVLFRRLGAALEDRVWIERAEHARRFVEAMAHPETGHLRTGTAPDGVTVVDDPRPLDVAPWALLASRDIERYGQVVAWAARHCWVDGTPEAPDVRGYDFNDDLDGVWWEGTAQMQLAHRMLGQETRARTCLEQLRAHGPAPGHAGAILACSKDGLTTGFERDWGSWVYWKRPHAGGATCWYVFAELGWNPFWNEPLPKKGAGVSAAPKERRDAGP